MDEARKIKRLPFGSTEFIVSPGQLKDGMEWQDREW